MSSPNREHLGALLCVHRPMRPLYAWAFLVAISSPFAILAAVGPPGPLVGVAVFLLFAVPFTYGFAEWLLLQHRIHEHGLVLRSIPGLRTYVLPYSTVDPGSLAIHPRHRVPRGELRVAERQQRECPFVEESLHLRGLHPDEARDLARGRIAWQQVDGRAESAQWRLSFGDPEHHRQLLARALRKSQGKSHDL